MNAFYDLHLHSCLSPCGDMDMTPNNIVGMATLLGLQIIALTDHNSCKNCPAVAELGEANGICVIPGMELTTAEEIHAVCLFPNLEAALTFDEYVENHRVKIKNRADIYGEQAILNSQDEKIGEVDYLLIPATQISVSSAASLVRSFGGICFPAHIDRSSYSLLSVLGEIPPECGFTTAEISPCGNAVELKKQHPILERMNIVTSSDAHYLENMREKEFCLPLDAVSAESVLSYLGEFNFQTE